MATEAVVAAGAVKPKEKKRKGNQHRVNFWAIECKYSVILDVVTSLGWKLVDDERMESKVNLFWIDVATIHERFRSIQPWQMINHFPGTITSTIYC
ncbi:hypothetical protein EON65_08270 [archaeon]|nr:MAG: hypothetical protein EON65_08270 [archaeon]